MPGSTMTDLVIEGAAHIVQLALTPVFLLSGVAALVNVFATRLGRVSDQADKLAEQTGRGQGHDLKLSLLQWRSRALDTAVVLAALAGASTCGAALTLFLGAVRGSAGASLLFYLFGGGLVLTVLSLFAFVLEMLLAARGLRHLLERSRANGLQAHGTSRPRPRRDADTPETAADDDGGDRAGDGGATHDAAAQSGGQV